MGQWYDHGRIDALTKDAIDIKHKILVMLTGHRNDVNTLHFKLNKQDEMMIQNNKLRRVANCIVPKCNADNLTRFFMDLVAH